MTRPYDTLGMPKSLGRKLPYGITGWNMLVGGVTALFCILYIFQVNVAATKSYELRKAEKQVEALKTETMVLQNKLAETSSVQLLVARATELGLIPEDRVAYVSPAAKSYALAK